MKDAAGVSVRAWANVKTFRNIELKLIGHLNIFLNGKKIGTIPNACTTTLKNKLAQGAYAGTMNAPNKFRLNFSDMTNHVGSIQAITGMGLDYVIWRLEYQNISGESKTIDSLDLGYDLGGGGEAIYAQITGQSIIVPDQNKIAFEWTIMIAYSSGGIKDDFRKMLASTLLKNGSYSTPPRHLGFKTTEPVDYYVAASLDAGGAGAENYFQMKATYISSGLTTVDILKLIWKDNGYVQAYAEDDIVDKPLGNGEQLEGFVKVTFN